jgi:serralysin
MKRKIPIGILAVALLQFFLLEAFLSRSADAADWYVDGMYGNDTNPGTKSAPFCHPWRGIQVAQPGDTVHLLPTMIYPQFAILDKTGTASAPITITGDGVAPALTQVKADGTGFAIQVNRGTKNISPSYITVSNFDAQAPGPWSAIYVGNGSHHIVITKNRLHNSGQYGVATTHADYITISHNTIYRNSQNTNGGMSFASGISTYENTDIDSNTGVKMIIDSNIVHDNTNYHSNQIGTNSDGSGIIVDDARHSKSDNQPYNGRTLIENNVVYNNGGRGIYVFSSDHVTVVNNTAYHNNQDPAEGSWRPGEIMAYAAGDMNIFNNIAYSGGNGCPTNCRVALSIESGSGGSITVDNNINFNAQNDVSLEYYMGGTQHVNANLVTIGLHNLWADPLFQNAVSHIFLLQPGSPGLVAASTVIAPAVDIRGKKRPPQGPTEVAAYQQ